jgi:hypothetical protein
MLGTQRLTRPRHYPQCHIKAVAPSKEYNFQSAVPVRPAFEEQTEVVDDKKISSLRQRAFQYVSAVPTRPAFDEVAPVPRQTEEVIGIMPKPTVRIDDKSIAKLLAEEVPDPNDFAWLAEAKRRRANGETEEQLRDFPPLGRKQKTIKKSRADLDSASRLLKRETKATLDRLEQDVKDGKADTEQGFTRIYTALGNVASKTAAVEDRLQLQRIVESMRLPQFFFEDADRTWYNAAAYDKNKEFIDIWLFSRGRRIPRLNPDGSVKLETRATSKKSKSKSKKARASPSPSPSPLGPPTGAPAPAPAPPAGTLLTALRGNKVAWMDGKAGQEQKTLREMREILATNPELGIELKTSQIMTLAAARALGEAQGGLQIITEQDELPPSEIPEAGEPPFGPLPAGAPPRAPPIPVPP